MTAVMINILLNFLLIFTVLGCMGDAHAIMSNDSDVVLGLSDSITGFNINIVETTRLSSEVAWMVDIKYGKCISVAKNRKSVIICDVDTSGNCQSLQVVGEGPDKVDDILRVALLPDGKFAVFDLAGIHVFRSDGKIINSCMYVFNDVNYNDNLYASYSSGVFFFPGVDPYESISSVDYFKLDKHFFWATVDEYGCGVEVHGRTPEESIYRELFFPVRSRPKIFFDKEDTMSVVFPFDKIVRIYANKGKDEVKKYFLNPDNFGNLIGASSRDLDEQITVMQANSAYLNIRISLDNYMVTHYQKGLDELMSNNDFLNSSNSNRSRFFELYDLSREVKIGSDRKDVDRLTLVRFNSLMEIWFYSSEYKGEEGLYLHKANIELIRNY